MAGNAQKTAGILALQGDFEAHRKAVERAGGSAIEVRTLADLAQCDGLIIPGGESTTMLKLLDEEGLTESLRRFAEHKPIYGSCAGAILLAREVTHPAQPSLDLMDIGVERNAYGRQIDSTILTEPTSLPGEPLEMVFIRAPRIVKTGPSVEILARRDGFPVLVRQGNLMAATFHPELSSDRRVHRLFVEAAIAQKKN